MLCNTIHISNAISKTIKSVRHSAKFVLFNSVELCWTIRIEDAKETPF